MKMASNRKLPFGYRMEFGEIVIHPLEAITVQKIFRQYALRLDNGIITLRIQQASLFPFYGAELFGQFIAAGYKNVRINAALLLQHGQELILTGQIRYLVVQLNDVHTPEQVVTADHLEVCEEGGEELVTVVLQVIIETEEGGVDFRFRDLNNRTRIVRSIMRETCPIHFSATCLLAECAAAATAA